MCRLIVVVSLLVELSLAAEIKARVNLTKFTNDTATNGGYLYLVQQDGKLTITGKIHTLQPLSKHGFHIHEIGSISNKCLGAGPHFNPLNKNHGGPTATERHIGDLGNIVADEQGDVVVNVTDSLALLDDEHSIFNRSVVVHANEDDLGLGTASDSKKTGAAGARIMCGVIERQGSGASGNFASLIILGLSGLTLYLLQQRFLL